MDAPLPHLLCAYCSLKWFKNKTQDRCTGTILSYHRVGHTVITYTIQMQHAVTAYSIQQGLARPCTMQPTKLLSEQLSAPF